MEHPSPALAVADYFNLMDGDDKAKVLDLFTADAVVVDNGHTYRGHNDLLGWLTGPASEFTTTSTWLSADQSGDTAVVTADQAALDSYGR